MADHVPAQANRPKRRVEGWRLIVLLLCAQSTWAADAIDQQIEQALRLRSSSPAQFDLVLADLQAQANSVNESQKRYIRYLQAYKLTFTGDFSGSIAQLAPLFEPSSPQDLQVRAGSLLVNNFAATRQFSEGLVALDSYLPLLEQTVDLEPRHQGFLAAGIFYNQLGQFELGQQSAERVLSEVASPRSRCFAVNLKIEAMIGRKAAPADDAEFVGALNQCQTAGEFAVAGFVGLNLARKMQAEQRLEDAINVLEKQAASVAQSRYPRLMGENHSLLAELEFSVNQWDAAQRHAQEAVRLSDGTPFSLPLVIAHRTLYQLAKRRGDSAAALRHYRRYAQADKAYLDDVKARELAFQMARHETLQKNQTIELLNQRNAVLQLEQQVIWRTTQAVGLLAALLALLAASIAFWGYKVKRLQMAFRELAETDTLTGLSNRHHFVREAEQTLAKCQKDGADAALIMIDLDRFKQINDRYGHAVGDWVLRKFAEVQRATCAGLARIGRLGGEEFAILLPATTAVDAQALAERCRLASANIDSSESGYHFDISASFGIADTRSAGYELHKLLMQADEAMYRAKDDGRNCVKTFVAAVG